MMQGIPEEQHFSPYLWVQSTTLSYRVYSIAVSSSFTRYELGATREPLSGATPPVHLAWLSEAPSYRVSLE